MKKFILNIFILVLLNKSQIVLANNNIFFVEGISDLPIFEDMKSNKESLVIFDTNEGRFVKSEIFGKAELEEAQKFYNRILPNLGWKEEESNYFKREKETLIINYEESEKILSISFKIVPN